MPSGIYNMTIDQGATFFKSFTYKINSNLVDLTGYTARLKAAKNLNSTQPILNMTTENGMITLGGENGTISLNISAADTTKIQAGKYIYDLELVQGSLVLRFLRGDVTVSPNVTR